MSGSWNFCCFQFELRAEGSGRMRSIISSDLINKPPQILNLIQTEYCLRGKMAENKKLPTEIIVNSLKYDKTIYKTWRADLIWAKDSLIILRGVFVEDIHHKTLGVIRRGTISFEYYWINGWYNIFRFHEPDGSFRNYYCNINIPPVLTMNNLNYIDLDVDVLVLKDFSYQILDMDEFEENSLKYSYPSELIKKTWSSLREVITLIENRIFPFDSDLSRKISPQVEAENFDL